MDWRKARTRRGSGKEAEKSAAALISAILGQCNGRATALTAANRGAMQPAGGSRPASAISGWLSGQEAGAAGDKYALRSFSGGKYRLAPPPRLAVGVEMPMPKACAAAEGLNASEGGRRKPTRSRSVTEIIRSRAMAETAAEVLRESHSSGGLAPHLPLDGGSRSPGGIAASEASAARVQKSASERRERNVPAASLAQAPTPVPRQRSPPRSPAATRPITAGLPMRPGRRGTVIVSPARPASAIASSASAAQMAYRVGAEAQAIKYGGATGLDRASTRAVLARCDSLPLSPSSPLSAEEPHVDDASTLHPRSPQSLEEEQDAFHSRYLLPDAQSGEAPRPSGQASVGGATSSRDMFDGHASHGDAFNGDTSRGDASRGDASREGTSSWDRFWPTAPAEDPPDEEDTGGVGKRPEARRHSPQREGGVRMPLPTGAPAFVQARRLRVAMEALSARLEDQLGCGGEVLPTERRVCGALAAELSLQLRTESRDRAAVFDWVLARAWRLADASLPALRAKEAELGAARSEARRLEAAVAAAVASTSAAAGDGERIALELSVERARRAAAEARLQELKMGRNARCDELDQAQEDAAEAVRQAVALEEEARALRRDNESLRATGERWAAEAKGAREELEAMQERRAEEIARARGVEAVVSRVQAERDTAEIALGEAKASLAAVLGCMHGVDAEAGERDSRVYEWAKDKAASAATAAVKLKGDAAAEALAAIKGRKEAEAAARAAAAAQLSAEEQAQAAEANAAKLLVQLEAGRQSAARVGMSKDEIAMALSGARAALGEAEASRAAVEAERDTLQAERAALDAALAMARAEVEELHARVEWAAEAGAEAVASWRAVVVEVGACEVDLASAMTVARAARAEAVAARAEAAELCIQAAAARVRETVARNDSEAAREEVEAAWAEATKQRHLAVHAVTQVAQWHATADDARPLPREAALRSSREIVSSDAAAVAAVDARVAELAHLLRSEREAAALELGRVQALLEAAQGGERARAAAAAHAAVQAAGAREAVGREAGAREAAVQEAVAREQELTQAAASEAALHNALLEVQATMLEVQATTAEMTAEHQADRVQYRRELWARARAAARSVVLSQRLGWGPGNGRGGLALPKEPQAPSAAPVPRAAANADRAPRAVEAGHGAEATTPPDVDGRRQASEPRLARLWPPDTRGASCAASPVLTRSAAPVAASSFATPALPIRSPAAATISTSPGLCTPSLAACVAVLPCVEAAASAPSCAPRRKCTAACDAPAARVDIFSGASSPAAMQPMEAPQRIHKPLARVQAPQGADPLPASSTASALVRCPAPLPEAPSSRVNAVTQPQPGVTAVAAVRSTLPPKPSVPTFAASYAAAANAMEARACASSASPPPTLSPAPARPASAASRASASQHAIVSALGTQSKPSTLITRQRRVPWAGIDNVSPGAAAGSGAAESPAAARVTMREKDEVIGEAKTSGMGEEAGGEACSTAEGGTVEGGAAEGGVAEAAGTEGGFVVGGAVDVAEGGAARGARSVPVATPVRDGSIGSMVRDMRGMMNNLKAEHARMSAELRATRAAAVPKTSYAPSDSPLPLRPAASFHFEALVEVRREAAAAVRRAEDRASRAVAEAGRLDAALASTRAAARAAEEEAAEVRTELSASAREVEALRAAVRSSAVAARSAVAEMSASQLREEVRRLRFEKELCRVHEAVSARDAAAGVLGTLERALDDETRWSLERIGRIATDAAGPPPDKPKLVRPATAAGHREALTGDAGPDGIAREVQSLGSRLARSVHTARRALRAGLFDRPPEQSLDALIRTVAPPQCPSSSSAGAASAGDAGNLGCSVEESPAEWRRSPAALSLAQARWLSQTCQVLMPDCMVLVFDPRRQDDARCSPWSVVTPSFDAAAGDAIVRAPLEPPPRGDTEEAPLASPAGEFNALRFSKRPATAGVAVTAHRLTAAAMPRTAQAHAASR